MPCHACPPPPFPYTPPCSNFVGFSYPAYASFRALETEDKNDDKQW